MRCEAEGCSRTSRELRKFSLPRQLVASSPPVTPPINNPIEIFPKKNPIDTHGSFCNQMILTGRMEFGTRFCNLPRLKFGIRSCCLLGFRPATPDDL